MMDIDREYLRFCGYQPEEVEERFVKSYPEFCCNGKPLSPFWDLWKAGTDFAYNKAKVEVEDSYRESLCNSELNLASVTEQLEYAETIIQDLLDNSDEYARERAIDFLKESE